MQNPNLTPDEVAMLLEAESLIKHAGQLITKMEKAGMDVSQWKAQHEYWSNMRNVLLQEFSAPGSQVRNVRRPRR